MIPDEFNCCICLDKFQIPKKLPCLHSICVNCLQILFDNAEGVLKCPICRQTVPRQSAESFPTDVVLEEQISMHDSLQIDPNDFENDVSLGQLFDIVPHTDPVVEFTDSSHQKLSAPLAKLFDDLGLSTIPETKAIPDPEPESDVITIDDTVNQSDLIEVVELSETFEPQSVTIDESLGPSQNISDSLDQSRRLQVITLDETFDQSRSEFVMTDETPGPSRQSPENEILKDLESLDLTYEERQFILSGCLQEKENLKNLNNVLEISKKEIIEITANLSSSYGNLFVDLADLNLTKEEYEFLANEMRIEEENKRNLDRVLELSLIEMAPNSNNPVKNYSLQDKQHDGLDANESPKILNSTFMESSQIKIVALSSNPVKIRVLEDLNLTQDEPEFLSKNNDIKNLNNPQNEFLHDSLANGKAQAETFSSLNSTMMDSSYNEFAANFDKCKNVSEDLTDLNLTPEEREFLAKGTQIEAEYQKNLNYALKLSRLEMEMNSNHSRENPLLGDLIDLNLTQEECDFLSNEFLIEKENEQNLNRGLELSLQTVSLDDIFDMEYVMKGIQFYEEQISIFENILNNQTINQTTDTVNHGILGEEDGAWGGAVVCEMLN